MIRPGTPDDAEAVARLHVETWQAAYAHALPQDRLRTLSVENRAEMHRRSPPLVAEVDGAVVGFVAVGPTHDEKGDGELYAIYVHPDHWGTGVGRALIAAGEVRLPRTARLVKSRSFASNSQKFAIGSASSSATSTRSRSAQGPDGSQCLVDLSRRVHDAG